MRIIFMGTPEFSVPTLQALLEAGHDIIAVYSQPPRPAGRGKKPRLTPVHAFAEQRGLLVRTPESLHKLAPRKAFEELGADVAVVVAYGLLLGPKVLSAPRHGCLNLHGSLLPRWRGAAPIQRAIMAGDKKTGVQVMRMETGLDCGPVCLSAETAIAPDMTAGDLHDNLMRRGAALMVEALQKLQEGCLDCRPQAADMITYAEKIDKTETHIDWKQPAQLVHNTIRGLSPFPGAWFEVKIRDRLERIRVLRSHVEEAQGEAGILLDEKLLVGCRNGAVRLLELQRAGKRPMKADEMLRGLKLPAGLTLL